LVTKGVVYQVNTGMQYGRSLPCKKEPFGLTASFVADSVSLKVMRFWRLQTQTILKVDQPPQILSKVLARTST
jgi:hypothetical protein